MILRVRSDLEVKIDAVAKQASEESTSGRDQLRTATDQLQAKLSEVEGKIASERAETGAQLDALRGQMQKEAAEEAKKAAAAMADEVKAGMPPPDVKGAVNDILETKMADLKKEVDAELQDQMQVSRVLGHRMLQITPTESCLA